METSGETSRETSRGKVRVRKRSHGERSGGYKWVAGAKRGDKQAESASRGDKGGGRDKRGDQWRTSRDKVGVSNCWQGDKLEAVARQVERQVGRQVGRQGETNKCADKWRTSRETSKWTFFARVENTSSKGAWGKI